LPFQITRMNGFTDVLQGCIPQKLGLAGLRSDLDVDDMETEARAHAMGRQIGAADDGPSGSIEPPRQVSEGQTPLGVTTVAQDTLIIDITSSVAYAGFIAVSDISNVPAALEGVAAGVKHTKRARFTRSSRLYSDFHMDLREQATLVPPPLWRRIQVGGDTLTGKSL
jgi:hypothetical protein